jgi:hypothetical protein
MITLTSMTSYPHLPRFACQTTIAAQFIRRKPCGRQTAKTGIFMPEIQKLSTRLDPQRRLTDAKSLQCQSTVNIANWPSSKTATASTLED